jgi:RecA-family ATPase
LPEFAEARGYWSLESAEEFRAAGWGLRGTKAPPRWLRPPGLVIPLYSPTELALGETEPCYSQFRPDRPGKDESGRGRKYVNPTGSSAIFDCNPAGYGSDVWLDRDTPFFIVEGVPKGDACWSAGLPAVSIQGVWNFTTQSEEHYRELIPDLRYLPIAGREVVIAFDADAWTNPDVRAAARELGRVLSRGTGGASKVSALRLPNPEKKTGIDDFLAWGGGKESVLELLVDIDELTKEKGAGLIALSEIHPEPPECLWKPYLLRNTLCFLDGAPGVGKTWLALALSAAVTRGHELPMGWRSNNELSKTPIPKGNVVFITQENSPAKSLRPRFDRLGGDTRKFFTQTMQGEEGAFTNLHDLAPLKKMIEEVSPVLVVLDPIMNYIGEKTDAHRDNEIRPMLSRLMTLAEEKGATILGLRHLRKASTGTAVYAAGGSVAFSGTARSVLLAAKYVKEGIGQIHVLAHAKGNDTPPGASLEYEIVDQGEDKEGFYLSDFRWKGRVDVEADALISEKSAAASIKPRTKSEEAEVLIKQVLMSSPGGVKEEVVLTAAEHLDISEKSLKAAAKALDVVKERVGDDDAGHWLWRLPRKAVRKKVEKPKKDAKY